MTSYINQTIARLQVSELIAEAERGRVRRQFRQSRRAGRTARRRGARRGPSNSMLRWPHRVGIA